MLGPLGELGHGVRRNSLISEESAGREFAAAEPVRQPNHPRPPSFPLKSLEPPDVSA